MKSRARKIEPFTGNVGREPYIQIGDNTYLWPLPDDGCFVYNGIECVFASKEPIDIQNALVLRLLTNTPNRTMNILTVEMTYRGKTTTLCEGSSDGEVAKDMYDDQLRIFVRPPSWMYHQHIFVSNFGVHEVKRCCARSVLSFAV